jgi:hypothetical protein
VPSLRVEFSEQSLPDHFGYQAADLVGGDVVSREYLGL